MSYTLLIFLGAGLGGVFRFWITNGIHFLLGRQFPYGTLVINMTGSFLMGFLFVLIVDRFEYIGPQLRSLLLIGFLGGYTTFSSFSLETLILFENGAWMSALLNIVLSVTLCILLAWLGAIAGEQF
jgi:CrcB protein